MSAETVSPPGKREIAAPEPPAAPVLQVCGLSVTFPGEDGGLKALKGVSFDLYPQEFVCLLGPSGSGKSTLLRVLAGLVKPSGGEFAYPGKTRPNISLVFQDANLMPWRSVLGNITLPLEMQGVPAEEARARAMEWIELVGLQGFEDAWPGSLSGGMAQRVAIARSLIQDPDLLLLDEPFGALDALTREKMGAELLNLWQTRRKTVLMVTHSISEALLLSDRVLVLTPRPGRIELDLPVPLPRPRQEEVRYTPEFSDLAKRLRAAIK
jgi:NitT/TauT family transport system ATP-binding protein